MVTGGLVFLIGTVLNGAAANVSMLIVNLALALICVYVAAFTWSWGPLGAVHQSQREHVLYVTFVIGQLFLVMLCRMKFGLFFFFAGWVVMMTVFAGALVPETKGMPTEGMNQVWKSHWFWGKYIPDDTPGWIMAEFEI